MKIYLNFDFTEYVQVKARDRLINCELLELVNNGLKSKFTMSEIMMEDNKALQSLTRLRISLEGLRLEGKRVSIRYAGSDCNIMT